MPTGAERNKANWEYRRGICEKYNASGLRAEDFCRQEGISYYAFTKWRSRIKRIDKVSIGAGAEPGSNNAEHVFVEVSRERSSATPRTQGMGISSTTAEITFPNQIRVELTCEHRNLKELMEVLSRC